MVAAQCRVPPPRGTMKTGVYMVSLDGCGLCTQSAFHLRSNKWQNSNCLIMRDWVIRGPSAEGFFSDLDRNKRLVSDIRCTELFWDLLEVPFVWSARMQVPPARDGYHRGRERD